MEPKYISPAQAEEQRHLIIVDIRPNEEREELGFIPGSLSAPMSPPWRDLPAPPDLLSSASGVVLACLSGQRARLAWREHIHDRPAFILEGGALAWGAAGLPLVTASKAQESIDGVDSPEAFLQNLRSCFVAEWIESALSSEAELPGDPLQIVEASFSAEGVSGQRFSPDAVYRVFDRLAWHSLRAGTAHAKIAANLHMMRSTLRSLKNR